jgi:N-methylhydantoinase B
MTGHHAADVDEVTLETIRNALLNITREMEAKVMNSSHQLLWQLAGDLSNALLTSEYELVAQPSRVIPLHLASMTTTLRAIVEDLGGQGVLEPEDVLMGNNPYRGNTHLPDVLLAKPIFVDDEIVGFSCVRGHWADIGGRDPTSHTPSVDSVYQEGLILPQTKVYRRGELNFDVLQMLKNNVRQQDTVIGDMKASKAGTDHGARRVQEVVAEYGREVVTDAMNEILDRSEQRMRNAIETLPDGTYTASDTVDSDGFQRTPLTVTAAVTVDGDTMTVDLSESAAQARGSMNSTFGATVSAVYYGVLSVVLPGMPGNSGTYRPIEIVAPSGTIVNPEFPAPVAAYHETANRIMDAVVLALSEVVPENAYAAGDGSSNILAYFGTQDGREFQNMKTHGGGGGAHAGGDGNNIQRNGVGNTGIASVESEELEYPVRIESYELVPNSGGPGRYRGGLTAREVTRFLTGMNIMVIGDRTETPPYGLADGEPGTTASYHLKRPDGSTEELPPTTDRIAVDEGTRFTLQSAAGGGYGDPYEREPERVLEDVRDGYVTPEGAAADYGVVVERRDGEFVLDRTATADRRANR